MSLPVLAILGSTQNTQQLFALSKDGKLPFTCKAIDGIKEKEETITYCNDQVNLNLKHVSEKYVLGSGNLIEPTDITTYYERALPKTACVFQAYSHVLKGPWTLIQIKKSLPLVTKDTLKFELVKVLQALRIIASEELENVKLVSTEVFQQKSLTISASLGALQLSVQLVPEAIEKELWSFSGATKKVEFDLVEQTYEVVTLLEPLGKIHHSYHLDKRNVSDASVWDLIFKSEKSLQNLLSEDWKWVENV